MGFEVVGSAVGMDDGVCDGNEVVGNAVGNTVGKADGRLDGIALGTIDGIALGTAVGTALGIADGEHSSQPLQLAQVHFIDQSFLLLEQKVSQETVGKIVGTGVKGLGTADGTELGTTDGP